MPRYRIKAYFMHEHEERAAQDAVQSARITEAEWTPSFVMGVVDEPEIESLNRQGLVISLVEEVESSGPTGPVMARAPRRGTREARRRQTTAEAGTGSPLPVTREHKTPRSKVLSHAPRKIQYYIVRFHGAITEDRRKELRKLRIKLLERISRNQYTVQLKPADVKALAALPFVDSLRLYAKADTLRVDERDRTPAVEAAEAPRRRRAPARGATGNKRPRRAAAPAADIPQRPPRTCIYGVRLHLAKDMPAVVKWLAARKHKPLWKRGDQLQVALVENSKLLTDLANRPEVAIVEQQEAPRLYDGPARALLGLVSKKSTIDLDGDGEIIGVADTGIDQSHPDLKKRIAGTSAWGRKGDVSDPEGHGTHVAGCAVGDGSASNGEVMGAAPKAKVFFQSILDANGRLGGLPNDIGDLLKEAYAAGARVHNNSWGAFSFARYSNTSLDVDRFVAANPDMLVIIAAGNDGIGIPRAIGAVMNAEAGFVDWPSVAAPATAKNGLTVGASRSSRTTGGFAELTWNDAWPDRYPHPVKWPPGRGHKPISRELISSDEQCLAAFSSRGPSDDLRIKPDVVAPGTDIAAAKSKDAPLHKFWGAYPQNNQYGFMGGTSMAAPYVAGCAALVREWYRDKSKGDSATPSAALLKATLINGTQRISGPDAVAELEGEPNFHQGFGRIDMSNTVPNTLTPKLALRFDDTWQNKARMFTKTGQRFRYQIQVGSKLPLRLCLAWTDPGARGLQNSLLLAADNTVPTKWVGNSAAPTLLNIAGGQRDPNNNVQIVRIEKPQPGLYTIAIFANNLLVSPQSFALVVTGDLQSDLIKA